MKREDLLKKLREAGCSFVRHGGNHDWYVQPATGVQQPVPRHREINELTARAIIRKLSAPSDSDNG